MDFESLYCQVSSQATTINEMSANFQLSAAKPLNWQTG